MSKENKNNKNEEIMEDEIIDDVENLYPYKWIDDFTFIDIEDIKRVKISHQGDGNYIVLFYSKTEPEPFEIYNKYFETIEDVKFYIWIIFQTDDLDVRDFNYFKEHPEEFEN